MQKIGRLERFQIHRESLTIDTAAVIKIHKECLS